MKRTLIPLLIIAGSLAGYCGNLKSATTEEMTPTNQRRYELIADIDLFQFKGENLTPAQLAINKALKDIRTNILNFIHKLYTQSNISLLYNYIHSIHIHIESQNYHDILILQFSYTHVNRCAKSRFLVNYFYSIILITSYKRIS